MGRVTGQASRMTLSYDFAFLAFLRMAVEKTYTEFDKKACIAHPLKKKAFAKSNSVLTYCAAATAILAAEKTRDDLRDEKGAKKLGAKILLPFEEKNVSKTDASLLPLREKVKMHLDRLYESEEKKTSSIDVPAEIFGELLGSICSFGYDGAEERITEEIGRCVGKIIYVLDAADDISDDVKCEKYNPIALVYDDPTEIRSENGKEITVLRADIRETLKTAVSLELKRARAAFSLLDTEGCTVYPNILTNILEHGIPEETEKILNKSGREHPLRRKV